VDLHNRPWHMRSHVACCPAALLCSTDSAAYTSLYRCAARLSSGTSMAQILGVLLCKWASSCWIAGMIQHSPFTY